MIIAVDGPAASGKGTLARRLAAHYGLAYLDTGLLYRAVGLALVNAALDPNDRRAAVAAAQRLDISRLPRHGLREEGIGEAASIVASIPQVRATLLDSQRRFADQPGGAVLDGRDIGTTVCPDADVKLFVTASARVRARRRHRQLDAQTSSANYDNVLADIERRDRRDGARAISPMVPAADAHLLDTTDLDIEAAFRVAVSLVDGSRSA
jgi:cytidylate kinase